MYLVDVYAHVDLITDFQSAVSVDVSDTRILPVDIQVKICFGVHRFDN